MSPLSGDKARQVADVRERINALYCPFQFMVQAMPEGEVVTEGHHRQVLGCLFEGIRASDEAHRLFWIAREPAYEHESFWQTEYRLLDARPSTVWVDGIESALKYLPNERRNAGTTLGDQLFYAFDQSPQHDGCPPGLFADFCGVVGLLPQHDIEVLDWVGDPDLEPERSQWSNYFEAGKEYWGIWCLTVWNPHERTLAALVASTTD